MLRRYRRKSDHAPLNMGALSRAKTELRAAGGFLAWLAERDVALADCRQVDVDAWLAGARPDRYLARSLARWAIAQKLTPKLDFPTGGRDGPAAPVSDHDRIAVAQRVLDDSGIATRDRVAGVLIVVFAQPVGRITRLTVDDIATDRNSVAIRFGDTAITLPEPLAGHLRELIAERRGSAAAVVPETRWLFPGGAPGRPIGEQVLSRRLKRVGVACCDARHTALLQLAPESRPRCWPTCSAFTS